MIILLFKNKKIKDNTFLLSRLNISIIMLGSVGGFGSLFSYFIIPMIRSYNRISVYIAYISILAFCIIVDKIQKKSYYYYFILLIIFIFSVYEQTTVFNPNPWGNTQSFYQQYQVDLYKEEKRFISKIEYIMPKNSMIYQLPSFPFVDTIPYINNRHHYKLMMPYILSDNLKWSYAYDYFRKEAISYEKRNTMNAEDLLNEIISLGFNGLYIDKYLFENRDYINQLINDIQNILNQKPITGDNNNLLFFNLN